MADEHTTAAVQRFLGELAGDAPSEPIIRDLLERAAERLHMLCVTMLVRSYPRLARPPLNLESEEMLSAVVERLIKAMRHVRPENTRQFFALANRHMRWELNDLARRLDEQTSAVELSEGMARAPETTGSALTPNARRMFDAIDALPDEEREVFELIRIQGMTHAEAADVIGTSSKTVQRRLNRGIVLLTEALKDLRPEPDASRLPPTDRM